MIRKFTKAGTPYHEPPYTEEELKHLDWHLDGDDGPVTAIFSGPVGDRYRALRRQSQSGKTSDSSIDEDC